MLDAHVREVLTPPTTSVMSPCWMPATRIVCAERDAAATGAGSTSTVASVCTSDRFSENHRKAMLREVAEQPSRKARLSCASGRDARDDTN